MNPDLLQQGKSPNIPNEILVNKYPYQIIPRAGDDLLHSQRDAWHKV